MCEVNCTQSIFGGSKYFFCVSNRRWGLVGTGFAYSILFFVGLIFSIVEMNKYYTDRINYNEILKEEFPVSLTLDN